MKVEFFHQGIVCLKLERIYAESRYWWLTIAKYFQDAVLYI